MKNNFLLCLLAASICLLGCFDNQEKHNASETQPKDDPGITYKAKQGLSVPEDIARHIGLKLADVTERKVGSQLAFTAQVYGAAGPQARRVTLASAWVDPTLAQTIPAGTDLVATAADTNSLAGVVTRVIPATSTNAPAEVLLEFSAGPSELKLGDFVRVTVTVAGKEDVVVIPRAALLRNTEGNFVYVVNGSRLLRAAVKVGGEQAGFIEIKDGLLAGDRIAVTSVPMLWLAELHAVNGGDSCCAPH